MGNRRKGGAAMTELPPDFRHKVNHFDALVAALQQARDCLDRAYRARGPEFYDPKNHVIFKKIDAALKAAREEEL
jgi:hypothetical protein